jgi:predicted  nucleic acid-binding Zn-ribbon protein
MAEKKTSTEMTVEEKLKNLYALQKVLSRIDEIRIIRGELPLEVQDLEDEIEGLTTRIANKKEEVAAVHLALNKWSEEKKQAQVAIERCNEQLNSVSNSREYDNLSKEIEYQGLEIELRDKRIRENSVKETEMNEAIVAYEAEKAARIQELEVKRTELDEIIRENKAEEDRLREESKTLEEKIEPRLLTAFKRIRKGSHNGLGVVVVERDSCGGCFAKIAPQRQLDVMFHKKIIVCEYCGRILVDPELAGIKVEKPVEEKKTRRRTKKAE